MMHINHRAIDEGTLEIEGVDSRDYPDFCDAYFSYAEFMDGTELTDSQLEDITNAYPSMLNDMAFEYYI